MKERRGRRRKQLLNDLKEKPGHRKLKQKALDHTCGELASEEAIDLSYDTLQNEWMFCIVLMALTLPPLLSGYQEPSHWG